MFTCVLGGWLIPRERISQKRIESMRIRLIQRTTDVAKDRIDYEYRCTEHEYKKNNSPKIFKAGEPPLNDS